MAAPPPLPPTRPPPPEALPFRKIRLDAGDYVWLRMSSIKSVGRMDGQVLLETTTQTYQIDPQSAIGARSPEQILADAMGEGGLADCIPTLKDQISDLIESRRIEETTVEALRKCRADLASEIRVLRDTRAKYGLSLVETGQSGILSIFGKGKV